MGLFAAPPAPSQRDLGDELEARLSLSALAAASESYGSVDGSKLNSGRLRSSSAEVSIARASA